MQGFTSNIIWTCPECGEGNSQDVSVPQLNYMAEKTSDMSTDDCIEISCDLCSTAYTGHVYVNVHEASFEIEEPHQFEIHGDMPMYGPDEEDYYYETPDDPYSVAKEALGHLADMVGSESPISDPQFTNRLVFSGAVSRFEAYLGDTLINEVKGHQEVRDKLLQSNKQLGEIKFSAAELAADAETIAKRVVAELRAVLYHNLKPATELYKDALGLDLMPSKTQRDILFPAMALRHHCVHRNGQDKKGKKLTDFDDVYVIQVITSINEVIDHLEIELTKNIPF